MSLTEAFLNLADLGSEWVLWILLALSVTSSAIVFERGLFFWKRRGDADELARQVLGCLRSTDPVKARAALLRQNAAAEALVLATGLARLDHGVVAASEAMHSARWRERLRMQSNLGTLEAIAAAAPALGLMGMLLGLARTFALLAASDPGELGSLAGPLLSGGAQALIPAALGLFVGIPGKAAGKVFQTRVRSTLAQIDSLMSLVLSQAAGADAQRATTAEPPAKAA